MQGNFHSVLVWTILQVCNLITTMFHIIAFSFCSTIRFNFVGADIRGTRLERDCPALPDCPVDDKYRTFDGSCNNLQNTEWGKANTDVQRFLYIHFYFLRIFVF